MDCVDVGNDLPGVKEQGYPDLDGLLRIVRKIRSFGLDLNRCTLPAVTDRFMTDREGGQEEAERAVLALRVYAEADLPIIRPALAGDQLNHLARFTRSLHRGG